MAADPVSMVHVEHHSIPLFRCLVVFTLCVCLCMYACTYVHVCVCVWGGVCLTALFPCIELWLFLV